MRHFSLILLGIVLGTAFVIAQVTVSTPQIKKSVEQFSDAPMPETVVIRATLPGRSLICAEPMKGLTRCRRVSEFRAWVIEAATVK